MFVLAVISAKGGSGKSTLAACIAVAAVEAGLRVVTVDADEQGSLSTWARRRVARDVPCHTVEPRRVAALVAQLRASGTVDLVVIDTAGVADAGGALAAGVADLVIVPVRPTRTDLDAVGRTIERLTLVGARFACVLSQVPPSGADRAREAARVLVKVGRVVPAFTGQRVAYADAVADGLGVTEFDPRGRAADEIRKLWSWIAREMEGGDGA